MTAKQGFKWEQAEEKRKRTRETKEDIVGIQASALFQDSITAIIIIIININNSNNNRNR